MPHPNKSYETLYWSGIGHWLDTFELLVYLLWELSTRSSEVSSFDCDYVLPFMIKHNCCCRYTNMFMSCYVYMLCSYQRILLGLRSQNSSLCQKHNCFFPTSCRLLSPLSHSQSAINFNTCMKNEALSQPYFSLS